MEGNEKSMYVLFGKQVDHMDTAYVPKTMEGRSEDYTVIHVG
jgi:hypothetical protein